MHRVMFVSCYRVYLVGALSDRKHGLLFFVLNRPPPGEQARHARYSIAFFTRPGDDVLLRHLGEKSRMIADSVARAPAGQYEPGSTAGDWTSRRIRNLRLKSRAVRRVSPTTLSSLTVC